jgi:hypothetical protein
MRLGLIDRLRRLVRWRDPAGRHRMEASPRVAARAASPRGSGEPAASAPFQPPPGLPRPLPAGSDQRGDALPWSRPAAVPVQSSLDAVSGPAYGGARARVREMPRELAAGAEFPAEPEYGAAPVEAPVAISHSPRQPWYHVVTGPLPVRRAAGQVAPRGQVLSTAQAQAQAQAVARAGSRQQAQGRQDQGRPVTALQLARARLPYVAAHPVGHPPTTDGRRNCGPLERVLHRQWDEGAALPAQVIMAVSRLAELPRHLQQKLADGLTGIFVGPGGVPDLDDMGALKGVPLPSGRATWDACAGAYGERKLVVGSRLSPTPDVMCHEVGHALDDLDAPDGKWQSDSPEFRAVYDQCKPHLVSDFHRQRGGLGRKEFFADAFAAIASGQRPALVDMLGGNTRNALWVMLYFNRRYGI